MIDKELLRQMHYHITQNFDFLHDLSDTEIESLIEEEVFKLGNQIYISFEDKINYKRQLFNSIRGLDVLQEYIDDEDISEIMVIGTSNIFIERNGTIIETNTHFDSVDKLQNVVQQIAGFSNRRVNEASPIVDSRLPDGSRVNIVLPPVALDGAVITIRKFPKYHMTMNDLIELGSISRPAANFLEQLVLAGYNIFVSGGTSSGKTTFLNILSNAIPPDTRIVTIEDSAELNLSQIKNLVRLETRQDSNSNIDITIRDLIRASLRMRPDRIIVGECRGAEALDMLQAMNTGHDGSMSTGHGNSAIEMLSRLETMVTMANSSLSISAIRNQIASAIDIIVHLGRIGHSRKVLEISDLIGLENDKFILNPIYSLSSDISSLAYTNNALVFKDKLFMNNISEPDYE